MNKEEITYKLNEMLDFARLSTDIGFIDQTEQIKVLESTLDLIDKLQKENEVLKEVHKEFATLCRELKTDDTLMSAKSVMEKVVSKDKIRTKIKEFEEEKEENIYGIIDNECIHDHIIKVLKELLN